MNGQWYGKYVGTNEGMIILELDRLNDRLAGNVYSIDSNPMLPGTASPISIPLNATNYETTLQLHPIDPQSGNIMPPDEIKKRFPDAIPAMKAETQWKFAGDTITATWKTDIGSHGYATLSKSKASSESELAPITMNWDDFLREGRLRAAKEHIFRGQEDSRWRLRTHYHRSGRADLIRYLQDDIPRLHRLVSAIGSHTFNLSNPTETGAFYSLVQHHGYPTPLLDWTHSPFIAAYFAFRSVRSTSDGRVRIFCFDKRSWEATYNQVHKVAFAMPHFSIIEPFIIGNPRAVPQQAISAITNVDDVESYVRSRETEGTTYLSAVDIPQNERGKAMRDLALMGITAGSMFPGLDGICQQLKEADFAI